MPRDKKIIHRATSDVEDEVLSEEEVDEVEVDTSTKNESSVTSQDSNDLTEERKKHLKDAILKRTQALKRERDRQQKNN